MWAMGDYPAVATEVIAALGPALVEATGIAPGDRVLDVAAGSGNAAIPAARAGADVVATDLTPELLETGRQAAEAAGRRAAAGRSRRRGTCRTPTASSTSAISCVGVMFAPHHQQAPTSWSASSAPAAGSGCSAGRRRASSARCSRP